MEEEITTDVDVRPSSIELWSGILAGPVAWSIAFLGRYAMVPWACHTGNQWALIAVSALFFIIACAGAFLSWRGWSRGNDESEMDARVRFMALAGVMLSVTFALVIVAMTLPDFFLGPCD